MIYRIVYLRSSDPLKLCILIKVLCLCPSIRDQSALPKDSTAVDFIIMYIIHGGSLSSCMRDKVNLLYFTVIEKSDIRIACDIDLSAIFFFLFF